MAVVTEKGTCLIVPYVVAETLKSEYLTQQTISGLSALSCSFQNYLKYNKHNSLHVVRKYARVKDIIVPVRYIDSHSFPRASFSEKLFTSWNRLMYADK